MVSIPFLLLAVVCWILSKIVPEIDLLKPFDVCFRSDGNWHDPSIDYITMPNSH